MLSIKSFLRDYIKAWGKNTCFLIKSTLFQYQLIQYVNIYQIYTYVDDKNSISIYTLKKNWDSFPFAAGFQPAGITEMPLAHPDPWCSCSMDSCLPLLTGS